MNKFSLALLCTAMIAVPQVASAAVTHTGDDVVNAGVSPSAPFGTLIEAVGSQVVAFGVDYSYGNVEGVFSDPPFKLCGINASNNCDLLTAVDGRIVTLNTTNQGLTNFISILAGNTAPNALTLSVFGINGNLLETTTGVGGNSGPYAITRASVDIAFFSIGGNDTFGVESVTIGDPIAAAVVPEPATWAMMIAGFGLAGAAMRRRTSATVTYA